MTRVLSMNDVMTRLSKDFIGFDDFARDFTVTGNTGFPPYNIERTGEDEYRLTLAVAGFSREDLTITVENGYLTIVGQKPEVTDEKREFIHRGIAERNFSREFKLGEYIEITGADMKDGLLIVNLKREIPEQKKPRTIAIGS